MSWLKGDRQPGETHGDFVWRQEMDEAAEAVIAAGDARRRGDLEAAVDREDVATCRLDSAARARERR